MSKCFKQEYTVWDSLSGAVHRPAENTLAAARRLFRKLRRGNDRVRLERLCYRTDARGSYVTAKRVR